MANLSQGDLLLAGYGGGLPMKHWLLSLEGIALPI
jgi:O6-methylguanine-DNA--protein-cysteine methyltransferase